MENKITIEGIICLNPESVVTPSGIPHRRWVLQHQSDQYEIGIHRKAWIRVSVVVIGQDLFAATEDLKAGDAVRCSGFISAHKGYTKSVTQFMIHAQKVEKITLLTK